MRAQEGFGINDMNTHAKDSPMKLKRCPFCNCHDLCIEATHVTWFVKCHACRCTGPESTNLNRACDLWNGEDHHQNTSALVKDRKSNRDDKKEIEA